MYRVIGADGKEYGPATADEVRQWLAQGRLHYSSPVLGEAVQSWRPLSTYTELLPPPSLAAGPGAWRRVRSHNNMALWGLVFGILSVLTGCCCCGCPFNLVAIVFCLAGWSQAEAENDKPAKSMAVIGLLLAVLSFVGIFLSALISMFAEAIIHLLHIR